jgi:glycosyltransferase involved in cell wall biosynthesis
MQEKRINVFLQYPWKFPDSSYYKNILDIPPKDVNFVNYDPSTKSKFVGISSSRKFEYMRRVKNIIRNILNVLSIPNITIKLNSSDIDLIHCAHCLVISNKPWIVDTEVYNQLSAGGKVANSTIGKWIIKKFLESRKCKRIIAWSEDCKKTFESAFPGNRIILDKITIVPFALKAPRFKKIKSDKIRLLFVARWFDAKGGRQTLYIFDYLTRKYPNVEATFICPTPQEYKNKYANNNKIKILDIMPQEKLFSDIYPAADIFVYPGFGDSYGFAMPEALGFGLPVVTVDSFARREIIKDGENGFIVPRPKDYTDYSYMGKEMLENLIKKTSILIENRALRERMSRAGIREVKNGIFSIKKRNLKLREIYKEAISN